MNSSDEMILNGFRSFNTDITKEYFYGYCRRAYSVLDVKYNLHNKVGMDFMSLAHEYYMQLLVHDFKPLNYRPETMKLSSYMYKGFWFVVMDALKAHKKEFETSSTADADVVLQYVRSTDKEDGMMEQVAEAVTTYYHDRKMAELAYMFFVLGYKQKEIAEQLGMTPSAVNQRYKKMMDEVVTPFVIENYGHGIYRGAAPRGIAPGAPCGAICDVEIAMPTPLADVDECAMCSEETTIEDILNNRITPEFISSLSTGEGGGRGREIFVFGSNLRGIHAGGAARMAHQHFGAEMGNGVGMQGQSYAIPTMQGLRVGELCSGMGGVETIEPYVNDFIQYAKDHPDLTFLVTPIGCGIAGFDAEDIAPLFRAAINVENIHLPEEFWECLE